MIKAISAGLRPAPSFNASLNPFRGKIIQNATSASPRTPGGGWWCGSPASKQSADGGLWDAIVRLADRARRKLPPDDSGRDVHDHDIGHAGRHGLIPAINYPEVAILGMGRVQEKPVVRDGQVVIRRMLPLTWRSTTGWPTAPMPRHSSAPSLRCCRSAHYLVRPDMLKRSIRWGHAPPRRLSSLILRVRPCSSVLVRVSSRSGPARRPIP